MQYISLAYKMHSQLREWRDKFKTDENLAESEGIGRRRETTYE